jgi:hypothetical protein
LVTDDESCDEEGLDDDPLLSNDDPPKLLPWDEFVHELLGL